MSNNDIILLVIAAINAIFALVVNTKNIQSAFVFKVIPFFCSVLLALIALGIMK
jgi:hypothetical protein